MKYFEEYLLRGVNFWGLTPQNEPLDGRIPNYPYNCMGWNTTTMRTFIAENLGLTLEQAGFGYLKLIMHDDQRPQVHKWASEVMSDPRAREYIDGIGVHW